MAAAIFFLSCQSILSMSQPFSATERPTLTVSMIEKVGEDLLAFLTLKERKVKGIKPYIAVCCHSLTYEFGAIEASAMQELMNAHKEEAKKNLLTAVAADDPIINEQPHYGMFIRYTTKNNAHDLLYIYLCTIGSGMTKVCPGGWVEILKESEGWFWLFRTKENRDAVVAWYKKMNAKGE